MTLIVTYRDPQIIIQISDRRFTFLDGSYTDANNKAALVCDRCTIAFTGLAIMGLKKDDITTDDWIAKALPKYKPREMPRAVNALKVEAEQALQKLNITPESKRLAFAVSGWMTYGEAPELLPATALVTNALRQKGWDAKASDEFSIVASFGIPKKHKFVLDCFGQPVTRKHYFHFARQIYVGLRSGQDYTYVMEQMASLVITTAKCNPAIGEALNVVSLPRPPIVSPQNYLHSFGPPNLNGVRFCSWPENGTQYGPNFICGGSAVSGVIAGSL